MKYCNNCGKKVSESAKFCGKCGAKLAELSSGQINSVQTKKNLIGLYISTFKKFGTCRGRASQKEYWNFVLFNFLIGFTLGFIEAILGINSESSESILVSLFQLAVFIPSITVGVRRMHDSGKRGWWLLVPLANLYFILRKGNDGENKYGQKPIN